MNTTVCRRLFREKMAAFDPRRYATERALGLYSAAVTLADGELMTGCIRLGERHGVTREMLYEIVLQSYLFLGFPRMLNAAENLADVHPYQYRETELKPVERRESQEWFDDGMTLCRKVYGQKYDSLIQRVSSLAPEVSRWMIIEGYGKVLSRPGLDIVSRELSIVAFLIMENREKQLHSHMMGAVNVGTPTELIASLVGDIGESAGDGFKTARRLLEGIKP
ncbi:MAG: hypothetical protein JSW34_01575 [Candidatus Zixiibacteriota bacterium]|nr:MAG: hypothetical protein JSW34_01575 [candidate division Zixibacteria bacterium]